MRWVGLLGLVGLAIDPVLSLATTLAGSPAPQAPAVDSVDGLPVLWSLRERLPKSKVVVRRGRSSEPCRGWDGLRFLCGPRPWHFVGRHSAPLGRKHHACVWVHGVSGADVSIQLGNLPETGRIVGYAGLVDGAGKRASVDVSVRSGGRRVVSTTLRADDGPHKLDARPSHGPVSGLEIVVHTREDAWRQVCLELKGLMMEPPKEAPPMGPPPEVPAP